MSKTPLDTSIFISYDSASLHYLSGTAMTSGSTANTLTFTNSNEKNELAKELTEEELFSKLKKELKTAKKLTN